MIRTILIAALAALLDHLIEAKAKADTKLVLTEYLVDEDEDDMSDEEWLAMLREEMGLS